MGLLNIETAESIETIETERIERTFRQGGEIETAGTIETVETGSLCADSMDSHIAVLEGRRSGRRFTTISGGFLLLMWWQCLLTALTRVIIGSK